MKRFLRVAERPLQKQLRRPSVRAAGPFRSAQQLLVDGPREAMLTTAIEFAAWSDLSGDYLEFGVWEGSTFAHAFHQAQRNHLTSMRFYAFDSFEGLPPISGVD